MPSTGSARRREDQVDAFVGIVAGLVVGIIATLALRRGPALGAPQMLELHGQLQQLARGHEILRHDLAQSREAHMVRLSDVARGLSSEIGAAQRTLAEVKSAELARVRQGEQAADSLHRLEAIIAGSSSRGAAGENIVLRALGQLPPDLLAVNVAMGSRVVEFALRLPGGRLVPIDSKWTSVTSLERLEDEARDGPEWRRLTDQARRDVKLRAREVARYLDPERTLGIAVLAVPDAVYSVTPGAHGDAYREGVLVVPYSMALPLVLALYRLAVRFGCAVEAEQLPIRLRALDEALRRAEDEIEGRLSRALVQAQNGRDALRGHVSEGLRATRSLLDAAEGAGDGVAPAEEPESA